MKYEQTTMKASLQLLCKIWKAQYSDLQELAEILDSTLTECAEYKAMDRESVISMTLTKEQYYCNAFYVFKTYYISSFPFDLLGELEVLNDFYILKLKFK